jgi:hypothetical protein
MMKDEKYDQARRWLVVTATTKQVPREIDGRINLGKICLGHKQVHIWMDPMRHIEQPKCDD